MRRIIQQNLIFIQMKIKWGKCFIACIIKEDFELERIALWFTQYFCFTLEIIKVFGLDLSNDTLTKAGHFEKRFIFAMKNFEYSTMIF